jgi:K+-sensing histidine kinase KdpD
VSVAYPNSGVGIEGIASVYTDISDLKVPHAKSQEEEGRAADAREIIDSLVHEIQNNLHVIGMGLDLLSLAQATPPEYGTIVNGMERTNKSLQELREYFFPPEMQCSPQNPAVILEEVVQRAEKEWLHQGVRLQMACRSPLPLVQLDLRQFRSALERVMEFSRVFLPRGGELEVAAGLQEIGGQQYVELKVANPSATSLEVEEKEVFRPFLRVNGHQVGLSLVLARQILHRHQGKIFFHKESPQGGLFTILLKANSAQ